MEIERKYRIAALPEHYRSYPVRAIEQAYLCTDPVVRVRRDGGEYHLTYKGRGLLAREEYNLPLNEQAYKHLLEKADGIVLTKDRYRIPMTGTYAHLTIELEFPTVEEAEAFVPPEWFTEDVTMSGEYQNSRLSSGKVDFC